MKTAKHPRMPCGTLPPSVIKNRRLLSLQHARRLLPVRLCRTPPVLAHHPPSEPLPAVSALAKTAEATKTGCEFFGAPSSTSCTACFCSKLSLDAVRTNAVSGRHRCHRLIRTTALRGQWRNKRNTETGAIRLNGVISLTQEFLAARNFRRCRESIDDA